MLAPQWIRQRLKRESIAPPPAPLHLPKAIPEAPAPHMDIAAKAPPKAPPSLRRASFADDPPPYVPAPARQFGTTVEEQPAIEERTEQQRELDDAIRFGREAIRNIDAEIEAIRDRAHGHEPEGQGPGAKSAPAPVPWRRGSGRSYNYTLHFPRANENSSRDGPLFKCCPMAEARTSPGTRATGHSGRAQAPIARNPLDAFRKGCR